MSDTSPDMMTRILDCIAALGGDVENLLGWKLHDKDGHRYWFVDTEYRFAMAHLDATATEIKAAAWELEGLLEADGWSRTPNAICGHLWVHEKHNSACDPDRIEAAIIAGCRRDGRDARPTEEGEGV